MSGNETAMTYLDNRAELTDSEQYVLSVLKVSLNGSEGENHVTFPEDAGCDDVLRMILRNGILLTVYDKLTPGLREKLQNRQLAALKQSITQDYEGKRVIEALAAAGMDCIALKGWELRTLYPDITMRQMADLDILVRPYNFLKIKSVMEKLGFSGEYETAWKHDSFKKSDVNVEVHKRLTDDSAAVRDWESGIWDRAVKTGEHIYKMTPEDFYIFHFVHLHKDFMNCSLGLRRVADTWLLDKQPVKEEIVEKVFEKTGLGLFRDRMRKLSRVCMECEPSDGDTDILIRHALKYGIYGTDKSYKAGRIANMGASVRSGKLRSKLAAVFLPYSRMKAQFPVLNKWPVLLPFCWLKRIFSFLRGNLREKRRKLDYSGITEEDMDEMKKFLRAGGCGN